MGCAYANRDVRYGDTIWDFDGQEIYRRAVKGMAQATERALAKSGVSATRSISWFRTRRTCESSNP